MSANSNGTTGTEITSSLLQFHSGSFDLDGIFLLNLSSLHILRLSSVLNQCTELHTLLLSHNSITSNTLQMLDGNKLSKLKFLDLSFNKLTDLNDFPALSSLHTLYLHNNHISSLSSVLSLSSKLPNLRHLKLKDLPLQNNLPANMASLNPCVDFLLHDGNSEQEKKEILSERKRYKSKLLNAFPNLQFLDGERIAVDSAANVGDIAKSFYEEIETLQETLLNAEVIIKEKESKIKQSDQSNPNQKKSNSDWLAAVSLPVVRTDTLDSEYGPRFAALASSLADCRKIDADALKLIREVQAKYPIVEGNDEQEDENSTLSANTPRDTPRDRESNKDKSASRKSTTRQSTTSSSSIPSARGTKK